MMSFGLLLISHFFIQRAKPRNFYIMSSEEEVRWRKIFFCDGLFFTEEKYAVNKKKPDKTSKKTNWKSQNIVSSKIDVETKLIFISKSDFKAKFRET